MELPVTTPSPDHAEFDLLCVEIDDFEPLPSVVPPLEEETDGVEETSLDGQILAALVAP